MSLLRALLFLMLLPSTVFASDSSKVQSLVNSCLNARPPDLNVNLEPEAFERAIQEARTRAEAACAAAERALNHEARLVRALKVAAEATPGALKATLDSADQTIDIQLQGLKKVINDLEAISNQPTDANNVLLGQVDEARNQASRRFADLKGEWDAQFAPKFSGPVRHLMTAAKDPGFTEATRESLARYLKTVPAYLLGQAPAPRQKIDFVEQQVVLTESVLTLKKTAYATPLRKETSERLRQRLEDAVKRADVQAIRIALLNRFDYQDLNWAKLAVQSGACELARTVILDQIVVLSAIPSADGALRADQAARQRFVAGLKCQLATDAVKARESARRWSRILPTICKKAVAVQLDLERWVGQFLEDVENAAHTQLSEVEGLHRNAELWNQGHLLALMCGGQ